MIIISILFFLLLSAIFSGSEIAFISASKVGVELSKNKGKRSGKILAGFYSDPKNFLATMLVGNNIALVVFTVLMGGILEPILGVGNLAKLSLTIITTIIVLIFGEFIPKTFFRLFANEILLLLAYPLSFFKWILKPITWIMNMLSSVLIKLIAGAELEESIDVLTRLDLEDYVDHAVAEELDDIETDFLKNALSLNHLKVRDCLVPRTEIIDIDVDQPVSDLLRVFTESNHSRIIVSQGDIENILGYVHHQGLLDNPRSIKSMIIPIPFVPEAMNAKDLMLRFKNEDTNIACVVDEFGGVAGIITLEDLLEEIFGEIEDEHDVEDYVEEQISENEYLFSGRLEITHINEKYDNLELPEGDYQTLSGYIVMTSGTIPEEKLELELDGYKFIFESVSDKKIETVRVIKLETEED